MNGPLSVRVVVKDKKWLPAYQSQGAAGADLFAAIDTELVMAPGAAVLVPTGLFIELPEGYEAQIR